MSSFSIRQNLASAAIALLLANPTTAAPPRLMSRGCLANIVSDLSCADSSIMTRCISIERVDVELLATCLEAAGCTPDEAENALWITEKCQTGPSSSSADDTQADREGELRRRSLHARNERPEILARADTTTSTDESTTASATSTSTSSETSSSTSTSTSSSATSSATGTSTSSSSTTATSTTSSASATSTSSSSSVDIGLSSAIVGITMGVAATLTFGAVFVVAWREGSSKRKAKMEAVQKEALLANMG